MNLRAKFGVIIWSNKNDIREQGSISGQEVAQLNFITKSDKYVFRKFYRTGLRSHIVEVFSSEDILKERHGQIIDGTRWFPRAKPKKMLRILRGKFENTAQVFQDIKRYKILLKYLGFELIASSSEFIVEYIEEEKNQIVLCGLQDYIEGEILDPWSLYGKEYISDLFRQMSCKESEQEHLVKKALSNIGLFVNRIKKMIDQTGYIPDLAGIGNLIVMSKGGFKLVDINNVLDIRLDNNIIIDDKGYPSCDKSVEVLSILEKDILNQNINMTDPLYKIFLSPERKKKVRVLEKAFYMKLKDYMRTSI